MSWGTDVRDTALGSTLAGAVAWGVCGVSPITTAAVLGTATLVYAVARTVFDKQEWLDLKCYVPAGLFLGTYLIHHFQLPSLSWWPGTVLLVIGGLVGGAAVGALLESKKNASPSPAK